MNKNLTLFTLVLLFLVNKGLIFIIHYIINILFLKIIAFVHLIWTELCLIELSNCLKMEIKNTYDKNNQIKHWLSVV